MKTIVIQKFKENVKVKCKPFLKWAGGKSRLLPELIRRIPSNFECYYEPFLGGGALFYHLQPKKSVLIDINDDLINCYKIVRDSVEDLIQDLLKHNYQKDYFYKIRNVDRFLDYLNWTEIEKASRFIYLNKTSFNGLYRVNSKGEYNVPFGRYTNPKILDANNLRACSEVLKNVTLIGDSFLSIENKITSKDFVYFDPPYLPLNTTSNFTNYSKDSFDLSMQVALRDLCERLDSRGIRFMLSNSSTSLISELYHKFNIDFVDASRSINSNGAKRGKIKEVLITNYKL